MIVREVQIGDTGAKVRFAGFPERAVIYAIESDGAVVYVGATRGAIRHRIRGHVVEAAKGSDIPIHKWMRDQQYRFDVRCLEEVSAGDCETAERKWIASFDDLLNLTDGGAGLSGYKPTEARNAKIGAALRKGSYFGCEVCGEAFWRKPRDIARGNNRFCSRGCFQEWQRGVSKPIPQHVIAAAISAAAAAKKSQTHCKRGHPLSGENLHLSSRGSRVCKECRKEHSRAYRARNR